MEGRFPTVLYPVGLHKTDEGYAVWCPALPGCWSQGQTEEEAIENIREAIKEYLAVAQALVEESERRYVEVSFAELTGR